ncbi:glycosyl hydrolase family 8 [Candidatus Margulisiibacteriota bacterium]
MARAERIKLVLIILAIIVLGANCAFAGPSIVGLVNGGALTDTYKMYQPGDITQIIHGNLNDSWGPVTFLGSANNFPNGSPPVSTDITIVIDRESNGGQANHTGYYAVTNVTYNIVQSPQVATPCTIRAIPIPQINVTGSTTALTWNVPDEDNLVTNNIIGYRIFRSISPTSGFTVVSANVATNNYTDSGLSNGTYYYALGLVFLGGVTGNYYSANSNAAVIGSIPEGTTLNITRFVAIAGDDSVTLNWVNPYAVADLEIRRSESAYPWNDGEGSVIKSWSSGSGIPETYTDSAAENGKLYYYVISATANGTTVSKFGENAIPVTANVWPLGYTNPETYPKAANWYWHMKNGWAGYVSRNIRAYGTGLVHDPSHGGVAYSEGIGYGLLLAVLNNDQPTFNYILNGADALMASNNNGLYAWKALSNGQVVSVNAATDADQDIALALIFADLLQRECPEWQSTTNYRTRAQALIDNIYTYEIEDGRYLKPGDTFGGQSVMNPSYFAPAWYRIFDQYEDTDHDWTTVINQCYTTLQNSTGYGEALVPDWCDASGAAVGGFSHEFTYDAIRTLWRTALDAIWFNNTTARGYADNAAAFIDAPSANYFNLNGNVAIDQHNELTIAMWAAGIMGASDITTESAGYNYELSFYDNYVHLQDVRSFGNWSGAQQYYFNQTLALFGAAMISGSFPDIYSDLNTAPEVNASLVTALSAELQPDAVNTITAIYVDRDGHGDLNNLDLRLENPQTANDIVFRLIEGNTSGAPAILEGSAYITTVNYSYEINGPTLNVTWNFILNGNWTDSPSINAGIRAADEHGHDSGYVYNTASLLVYDVSMPVVTIITNSGADFTTINSRLIISGTVSYDASIVYLNGSTASVNYTGGTEWSATVNMAEGNNVFSVTAVDSAGNTSNADVITITYDNTPPTAVTGLTALPGNAQAQIGWVRPADPAASGTLVIRSTQDITWKPASQNTYSSGQTVASGITVEYTGAAQTFTDTGLTNRQKYYYAAFAYDSLYWYSDGVIASVTPTPSAISNLQISRDTVTAVNTKETITLTWNGPTADIYALTNTYNAEFSISTRELIADGVTSPWVDITAVLAAVNQRYYRVVDEGSAPVSSLVTVGKFDIVVEPGTIKSVSFPLIQDTTSVNLIIGDQLTGANNNTEADWVRLGIGDGSEQYYKGYNGNWWLNNQSAQLTINNTQGFEIGVQPGNNKADITIIGRVSNTTLNISLVSGENLIGWVYPKAVLLNAVNLGSGLTPASNATEGDKFISEDEEAWLERGGFWYTGNDPSTLMIKPGKSYKVMIQGDDIIWKQKPE